MNQTSTSEVVGRSAEATSIINADGEVIEADEKTCEIAEYEKGELLGMDIDDLVAGSKLEAGRLFEKMLLGKCTETTIEIVRGDRSVAEHTLEAAPITYEGEACVEMTITDVHVIRPAPSKRESFETPDPTAFNDIDDDNLAEIVKNIRIDGPDGKMPLNGIMLDLAVGHNELEEYKKGALALHQAIDERLQEAERNNPDSDTCAALREAKDAAFGLYLRVQRGDEELHGHKDGRYSGYFN